MGKLLSLPPGGGGTPFRPARAAGKKNIFYGIDPVYSIVPGPAGLVKRRAAKTAENWLLKNEK
ncbi:hypothetical protein DPQ25_09835 [Hydrogeniiclostridium mannosilyticum]|uniref:Uncharacterized protein n=1 Tax=Hydrogeniiclostridium mannosilyticum TaxID=2764322 RepID=A0A328U9Z3_9FIRM|nr:hypothetical protein DPQ25_09835 [Hydrogeniiclostridium mannosilyticum]